MKSKSAPVETPDELNPEFIFSITQTELLLKIASGEIDIKKIAKKELASRGIDKNGKWAGFTTTEKIWGVK